MLAVAAFVSFGLLLYAYVGYPVFVALLARLSPLRTRVDPEYLPTVTACVPVHNAASHVEGKLESLLALDYPRERLEVVVYSDGSSDGLAEVVSRYAEKDERVRFVDGGTRRGKPYAINRMRDVATGDVLLMTDVRQPLEPSSLRALVASLSDPVVGCVSGNLVLRGLSGAGFYWRYESWIRRNEARFRSMVGVTGPVYVIRRADLERLPGDIILDDMWVPMGLRLKGRRLLLNENAIAYDEAFDDKRESGRKVRTLAGNYQLFARMPRLLIPFVNPSWFETFSHKILRLMSPFLAASLLVSSTLGTLVAEDGGSPLPGNALQALLAAQVLFYLMALAGPRLPRWGTVARSFVVLNWAAVIGLWRFLRGGQPITW
jgi:cellulose synthase/poly-beta-1,6-N-acetylglucosamine synthase-like glycosyltransferase